MRKTPLAAVHELDIAFNQGDLDATLSFYEDSASIVIEPGKPAITSKAGLRAERSPQNLPFFIQLLFNKKW